MNMVFIRETLHEVLFFPIKCTFVQTNCITFFPLKKSSTISKNEVFYLLKIVVDLGMLLVCVDFFL